MPFPSVTSTTAGTQAGAEPKNAGEKAAIDKEAFLKLLVAQLSNQDPLKPTEGTEFVAQLSQFAMVEQSIAQSSKLDLISNQMGGLASNEAAGLLGKSITARVDGKDVTGKVTQVSFDKGYPELRLDSGSTVGVSELVTVGESAK